MKNVLLTVVSVLCLLQLLMQRANTTYDNPSWRCDDAARTTNLLMDFGLKCH